MILLFISPIQITFAFQLSPAVATLEPAGVKSEQVYLLTNSSQTPMAIEFKVLTRQQQRDGSETREATNQLFSIHPTQVVIPSGKTQKIRLRWLGGAQGGHEQAYRFIAKQLPIQLTPADSYSLQVTLTLEGAIYIKPAGQADAGSVASSARYRPQPGQSVVPDPDKTTTQPQMLVVEKVSIVNTPQGKQLALTIKNPAAEHILLNQAQVQLISSGKTPIILREKQLGNLFGQNLLSGATRNFMMPIPQGFDQQAVWYAKLQKVH